MSLMDFFRNLKQDPALLPTCFSIDDDHTDNKPGAAGGFEPRQQYLSVTVNEMYLTTKRKWFKEFEPMVVSVTEYVYGDKLVQNPFVVGSSLLDNKKHPAPNGTLFHDTRVAGIHPYLGDRITLNMALYRSQTKDHLANALELLEKVSGIFNANIAGLLKNIVEVSNVVISGVDKLTGSGAVKPLFGWRIELDPVLHGKIMPAYYVMIDKSEREWDKKKFFVKKSRLFYGDSLENAKEFREDEYILFSLLSRDRRDDYSLLPVYKTYEQIVDFAAGFAEITDEDKKKITALLRGLNFEIMKSPDFTEPDGARQMNEWYEKIKKAIEPKFNLGAHPAREKEKSLWTDMDDKILAM